MGLGVYNSLKGAHIKNNLFPENRSFSLGSRRPSGEAAGTHPYSPAKPHPRMATPLLQLQRLKAHPFLCKIVY